MAVVQKLVTEKKKKKKERKNIFPRRLSESSGTFQRRNSVEIKLIKTN